MCLVETGEYVAEGIGAIGELYKERGKEVAAGLLVDISKVEIKVCHRGRSRLTEGYDIVDD